MMHAIHRWYCSHSRVNDAFPLKLTLEVGNAEIEAQVLDDLMKELAGAGLYGNLNKPFRFMGIIVELKLRLRYEEVNDVSRGTHKSE